MGDNNFRRSFFQPRDEPAKQECRGKGACELSEHEPGRVRGAYARKRIRERSRKRDGRVREGR